MGLFGRAKNLFKGLGGAPEVGVQYYNVVCPLGHRVRGQRTEGYQALRCPACGEGVFVLPVSPLPDPGPRLLASSGRRSSESSSPRIVEEGPIELHDPDEATVDVGDEIPHPDAEISWEDDVPSPTPDEVEPDAQPSRKRTSKPAREPGTRPVEAVRAGRSRPARPARRAEVGPPVIEVASRKRRRTGWSPLWVFAAVALIVVGTVTFRTWRNLRQSYPQIAELGREEGIPALEAGDFDRAHQLLQPARQAVDALGGQVEGADEIRSAADEAALYVALATVGLEELLDEAAIANPTLWASKFKDHHRGRGVLFDSRITASPESPEGRYEIDYVVMPSEEAGNFRAGGARPGRSARVDFKGFELFELAQPKVGDHVVFGARLAAVEFDADANAWVVRLEPKSGLFVRFHKALESLGWPEESQTAVDPGVEP